MYSEHHFIRSKTKTTITIDQSAFSILATKLHRIEQCSIQKKSCATVKNWRHVTLATLSREKTRATKLREKIAGVTSVLSIKFTSHFA